jgi:hypothetical protein
VTDLAACDAAAAINGIDVRSSDRHVASRVTVLAGGGYLTFNEQSWNLVRPIYGRRAVGANNVTFSRIPRTWSLFSLTFTFKATARERRHRHPLIEYGDCSPALVNRTAIPLPRPTVSLRWPPLQ